MEIEKVEKKSKEKRRKSDEQKKRQIPKKKVKKLAGERKIKLSEVMRRIISGTEFDPENTLKERRNKDGMGSEGR